MSDVYAIQCPEARGNLETTAMGWWSENGILWQQSLKVCLEKEATAFDEKHSLLNVKHTGGPLVLWGCVAASMT